MYTSHSNNFNPEELRGVPNNPETQLDPEFVRRCEQVIFFFLNKPGFRVQRSQPGNFVRESVGLAIEEWSGVAKELMKVSGVMYSKSSDNSAKTRTRTRLPNDILGINPEILIKSNYPYCTDELKHSLQIKAVESDNHV